MASQKKIDAREAWLRRVQNYWNVVSFPKFNTRIGEIYEVDFGENVGTEFSGRHLAVCLLDTMPNQERTIVVPLTTKYEEYNIDPRNIIQTMSDTGVEIKAGVVLGEARWISKARIFRNSIILGEDASNILNKIVKGRVRVSRYQLTLWSRL
jgi:mRNA-degrading endonuclease toxin of MazEF toxin-antitoxin module